MQSVLSESAGYAGLHFQLHEIGSRRNKLCAKTSPLLVQLRNSLDLIVDLVRARDHQKSEQCQKQNESPVFLCILIDEKLPLKNVVQGLLYL